MVIKLFKDFIRTVGRRLNQHEEDLEQGMELTPLLGCTWTPGHRSGEERETSSASLALLPVPKPLLLSKEVGWTPKGTKRSKPVQRVLLTSLYEDHVTPPF